MANDTIIILTAEASQQNYYRSMQVNGNRIHTGSLYTYLELIERNKPSLILLDCSADIRQGITVLTDIKSRYSRIPVIFITERASEDVAVEAFRCGARDFIRKPIDMDELCDGIERLLSIAKSSREKRRLYVIKRGGIRPEALSPKGKILPASIVNVITYIEANLAYQICLDDLAKVYYTSKYHFCKIFKKYMGISPLKYVAFLRVSKAKNLLLRDDLTISDVAWEVGFNDLSNFNKHFKKHTGISPSAYKTNSKRPGHTLGMSRSNVHLRTISSN